MNESFDPFYFEPLFSVEDRHFWFRTRKKILGEIAACIEKSLVHPHGFIR